eukprot:UN01541
MLPTNDVSPDILLKSSTMNSINDVITAEKSILSNLDYLKTLEHNRATQRAATGIFVSERHMRDKQKINEFRKKHENLDQEKKELEIEIKKFGNELNDVQQKELPANKDERLEALLSIATLKDELNRS